MQNSIDYLKARIGLLEGMAALLDNTLDAYMGVLFRNLPPGYANELAEIREKNNEQLQILEDAAALLDSNYKPDENPPH